MKRLSQDVSEILNLIDEEELIKLAVDMGNIHGPSGYESDVGDFVYDWFQKNGIDAVKQEVSPGRFNVVGFICGSGEGKSVIFDAHMDSEITPRHNAFVGGVLDKRVEKAWVEGDHIFGHAVMNDRGPLAAFMLAGKAIKNSGVRLQGDLIMAAVCGEIGMAPIDEFQGPRYIGKGLGTKHLIDHGVIADYAVVAETTDFGVTWVECGACYLKIIVKGTMMYTPRSSRTEDYRTHPNAIVKAARVIQALEEWAAQYERENVYEFKGGQVRPKVAIGAIRGGLPYKPNRTVGSCSLYVDVRLLPGQGPGDVLRSIRNLLSSLDVDAEVEPYLFRKGYIGQGVEPLVETISKAYQAIKGEDIPPVSIPVTSMWRDINIFNSVGIPAVTFGPRRISKVDSYGKETRCLLKEDLVDCAKMYTMIALDVCCLGTV